MKTELQYRPDSYFKPDTLYLIDNGFRLIITYAEMFRGNYWFTYSGMHIKAITAKSIALSDLAGHKIFHKEYTEIIGHIMGHTAIINSPYLYVYFDRIEKKVPMPCSLPDINDFCSISN